MLEVIPHQSSWREQFMICRAALAPYFADTAIAISHIGSTAIADLVAKPIIDVQVSVEDLAAVEFAKPLPHGFERVPENDHDWPPLGYDHEAAQWHKHYLHCREEERRIAHVHIREVGRANERIALLFRDFLRAHPLHREAYGRLKLQLAETVGHLASPGGSGPYVELKDPIIALILHAAEQWATQTHWRPEQSRLLTSAH